MFVLCDLYSFGLGKICSIDQRVSDFFYKFLITFQLNAFDTQLNKLLQMHYHHFNVLHCIFWRFNMLLVDVFWLKKEEKDRIVMKRFTCSAIYTCFDVESFVRNLYTASVVAT